MPRARRSSRVSTQMGYALYGRPEPAPLTDELFFSFIEYLWKIAQDSRTPPPDGYDSQSDQEDQRPSKRSKPNPEPDYIPIARRTFTFSRPASQYNATHGSDHQVPWPVPRITSNAAFWVSYRCWEGLSFIPRAKKALGSANKVTFTPQEMGNVTEADNVLLCVAEKTGSTGPDAGYVLTSVGLAVHCNHNRVILTVDLELRWNRSIYASIGLHSETQKKLRQSVLKAFFPQVPRVCEPKRGQAWTASESPQDFYEAAHVTSRDDSSQGEDIYVPGLTATLFPFQSRAVKWLLQREGVRWTANANGNYESGVVPYDAPSDPDTTSHFVRVEDADGEPCYASDLFGVVTRDPSPFEAYERSIRGGILSEEMGLGKTVEMISLILLHRRPLTETTTATAGTSTPRMPRPTGATLVVTPPALLSQWEYELQRHAPNLKVMSYKGMAKSCTDEASEASMTETLAAYDVVITTYKLLRSELHFAVEPPSRSLRGGQNRHRPRSPLVQLSWWRVLLDEAQEIENGVTNAATVVRVIPRVNAWGVTGTPMKNDIEDLWGLLLFLRYDPYASIHKVWKHLISAYPEVFRNLFGRIALRHTKRAVGDELSIPPQKRYVIRMPFTAVEEQHYQSLFKQLVESCGLDTMGAPLQPNWDYTSSSVVEAMQSALNRLRQTALHPEIGEQNRRALGRRDGPMRTVVEVLDAMVEQSEAALLSAKRAFLSHKLKRGQLLENSPRVKEALAIWQSVLKESEVLVQEARDKLKLETEKAAEANEEAAKSRDDDGDSTDDDFDESDDPDKKARGRVRDAQRDLRYALELMHRAQFFCANGYFQIKSNEEMTAPGSDEFARLEKLEVEGYEQAKRIRQEILRENRTKAMRLMAELSGEASKQGFATIPECQFPAPKGIEGRALAKELEQLGCILNDQANQMDAWREAAIQLLLKDLVDEDEEDVEITGDEYENSTKVQDEIQAFLTILKLGISDRQMALTGLAPSGLVQFEGQTAMRLALDDDGPAPGLMRRLFQERAAVAISEDVLSMRAVMVQLRDISVKLRNQANNGNQRAQVELTCITELVTQTHAQQQEQLKANTALEKESDRVRSALNRRIAYYRQLQMVSDMVALYEGPKDELAVAAHVREEAELGNALATAESKHRYLLHLKEDDTSEESRLCVICQSTFSVGVLTVCGHQFCTECITLWFRAHHNCPMCKRRLAPNNLHDIVLKPRELRVVSEGGGGGGGGGEDANEQQNPQFAKTKTTGIYSTFSAEKLAEINNIDLPGPSFTTKVDTLVRHLLWLRASDPGAKTIVFSQFPDFLQILGHAFAHHKIGFSRYADGNGITAFREDPSIECFLLHARAHSSGLNLVNASHVILCEPLVNTALELQAIARVHRIGQEHETTVWLYIVDGSVEESIYNLSVQRRLKHMGRNLKGKSKESTPELLDSNLELANSMELQQAQLSNLMSKGKMNGENVPKRDLWMCLFGNTLRPDGDAEDERLRNNPTVRRYLLAYAAEERQAAVEVD